MSVDYRSIATVLMLILIPAAAIAAVSMATYSEPNNNEVGEPIPHSITINVNTLDESFATKDTFSPGAWVVINVTLYLPTEVQQGQYYYYYQTVATHTQRFLAYVRVSLGDTVVFQSGLKGVIDPDETKKFQVLYKLPYDASAGTYTVRVVVYNDWPAIAGANLVVIGDPVEVTFTVTSGG